MPKIGHESRSFHINFDDGSTDMLTWNRSVFGSGSVAVRVRITRHYTPGSCICIFNDEKSTAGAPTFKTALALYNKCLEGTEWRKS